MIIPHLHDRLIIYFRSELHTVYTFNHFGQPPSCPATWPLKSIDLTGFVDHITLAPTLKFHRMQLYVKGLGVFLKGNLARTYSSELTHSATIPFCEWQQPATFCDSMSMQPSVAAAINNV